MIFRKMTEEDLDAAAAIAAEGKAFLKRQGVSQWQRGSYPDRESYKKDVENGIGYVVEEKGTVLAVCAVMDTEEPTYRNITHGKWLTGGDARYATVHRSAVGEKYRGKHVSQFLFRSVCEMAGEAGLASVRVDTHEDNRPMRGALEKAGFSECCGILLNSGNENGDPRLGYEKVCRKHPK